MYQVTFVVLNLLRTVIDIVLLTVHILSSVTVLASFPLCDMTEEDLTQNPQLCKLLATLSQHVDQTGLTVSLKTELDKVSADTVLTPSISSTFDIQAHCNAWCSV